ncbi:MAG: hypothetical protein V3U54_12915 [Thermodesulfobacteriota bacterium]
MDNIPDDSVEKLDLIAQKLSRGDGKPDEIHFKTLLKEYKDLFDDLEDVFESREELHSHTVTTLFEKHIDSKAARGLPDTVSGIMIGKTEERSDWSTIFYTQTSGRSRNIQEIRTKGKKSHKRLEKMSLGMKYDILVNSSDKGMFLDDRMKWEKPTQVNGGIKEVIKKLNITRLPSLDKAMDTDDDDDYLYISELDGEWAVKSDWFHIRATVMRVFQRVDRETGQKSGTYMVSDGNLAYLRKVEVSEDGEYTDKNFTIYTPHDMAVYPKTSYLDFYGPTSISPERPATDQYPEREEQAVMNAYLVYPIYTPPEEEEE